MQSVDSALSELRQAIDSLSEALDFHCGSNDPLPHDFSEVIRASANRLLRRCWQGCEWHLGPTPVGDFVFCDPLNAATGAVARAARTGDPVTLDVCCRSQDAADAIGEGESYAEDPEASVTARIVIRAEYQGRVA